MEELRELANRVRISLLPIATGPTTADLLWLVNAASDKLATYDYVARKIEMGATDLQLSGIPIPPPDGVGAAVLLQLARLQFVAIRRDHAMAGHLFVLYGTRLGLHQGDGDPMWQIWHGHHATSIQNADGVLQALQAAIVSCEARVDAVAMADLFPPRSPAWFAWISASKSHVLRAANGVTLAETMVRQMRRSVLLEYIAVSLLLNG
jgi:hypothetical protein